MYMVEGNWKKHPANLDFVKAEEAILMALQKVCGIISSRSKKLLVRRTRKNVSRDRFEIVKMMKNCDLSWRTKMCGVGNEIGGYTCFHVFFY